MEGYTEKSVTSVRKLITAVELLMDKYSENLTLIAQGKPVLTPIDDKTTDTMIKIVKEMNSFVQFEKLSNPELIKEVEKLNGKKKTNIQDFRINGK